MATRLSFTRRTLIDGSAFTLPPLGPADPSPLPGYDLIDDAQTSGVRTWSSQRIAAELAGVGGGGGGAGAVFIATVVAGTANAILLTVPGLILSSSPVLIQFDPALNNTGATTVSVNGSGAIALVSRLGLPLIGDELIAPVPALIRVSTATAKIVTGSI